MDLEDGDDDEQKAPAVGAKRTREAGGEESRAKRSKVKLRVTVGATGFSTGDTLYGYAQEGDRGNVGQRIVLKVVEGGQRAHRSVVQLFILEDLVKKYAKKFNVSFAIARTQVDQITSDMMVVNDNAQPIGSSCPGRSGEHDITGDCSCHILARFQILQPGRWLEYAEEVGKQEEMMNYIAKQTPLTWRQILQMMGKHTLVLRSALFEIATDVIESVPNSVPNAVMCNFENINPRTVSFRIDEGLVLTVDASRSDELMEYSKENCIELATRALKQHEDYASEEFQRELQMMDRAYESLSSLTIGGLKSAVQKVIRFSPVRVHLFSSVVRTMDVEGEEPETIDAGVYAALICSMIMLHRGGFVPDLQTYTRGNTSALKRGAVILVEDAWAGSTRRLAGFLGVALVCQLMHNYQPSTACMRACVWDMFRAAKSNRIVDWRTMNKSYTIKSREPRGAAKTVSIKLREQPLDNLEVADRLLRILRSFGGDMDMFTTAAEYARRTKELRFIELVDTSSRPALMPDYHLIDQHAYPGIGHVLDTRRPYDIRRPDTFKFRFGKFIFTDVTGINPRLHDTRDFEQRVNVQLVRFAQRMVMRFVAKVESPLLRPLAVVAEQKNVPYSLNPGVLAAGVGPVEVRVGRLVLFVILGVGLPHEEVVMLKPGRSARDNLNWGKSDKEKEKAEQEKKQAIEKVRQMSLPVRSPLLPSGKRATFHDGQWLFDGVPWLQLIGAEEEKENDDDIMMMTDDEDQQQQLGLDIDIHESPSWWDGSAVRRGVLGDEDAIAEALSTQGTGITQDAKEIVQALCEGVGIQTVMRAKYLLHQKFEHLKMPVPSRGGGLAPDQLLAMPGDWNVYRFFVLLCRVVPGALRPSIPPRFTVPNAILIQMVANWISEWLSERNNTTDRGWSSTTRFSETPFTNGKSWTAVHEELQRILKPHQRDAVQLMHQRARSGHSAHFLVMDTGSGKTFTAMAYILSRLRTSALGENVKRIIWVTPTGIKNTLINDQLRKLGSLRFLRDAKIENPVPLSERALKVPVPLTLVKRASDFSQYNINVISQDALRRKDISAKLYELSIDSAVVFDEVDQSYGASLRTSHALRLAGLCPEFVAMTATPIPASNQLDRAADWLGMTENYPITRKNYLVAATAMVSLRASLNIERVYSEVKVPLTEKQQAAFKQYQRDRDWRTLAMGLIADTTPAMCDTAVRMARNDIERDGNSNGGCLVVCDSQRHIEFARDYVRQQHPDVTHGEHSALRDQRVMLVFVTKTNNRGYDAVRLGAMVRQPYAGSVSSRIQMEGRLPRIGQQRAAVDFAVVFMENTMMHLLYERQEAQDTINYSLEQLALEYESASFE